MFETKIMLVEYNNSFKMLGAVIKKEAILGQPLSDYFNSF